ncbi:MAG TPA: MG2 domain-containing protein [Polyangiaceae bacterium]|nr:MG2 domain-containing protein [Polyangiaceae bacterium]
MTESPRRPLAPVALAVIALSMACMQGATAPQVAPRGTLAPGEREGGEGRPDGPFAVVFGSPKGQTNDPSEITLVFNRPMRPLDLAGDEARAPATITPAAKGRWQWVGTNALLFTPEDHLPRATAFTVEVPKGTRALDGSVLEAPYKLGFSTARPAIVSVEPSERSEDLKPNTTFTVRFNQPIAEAEAARSLGLTAGEQIVAFDVSKPDPSDPRLLALTPRKPLPLEASIQLLARTSLRGLEGPLDAGREMAFSFRTYGPLRVKETSCDTDTPGGGCAVDSGLRIELTNPVKLSEWKKAIKIEPAVKIEWPSWLSDDDAMNEVSVYGRFAPGKRYRLRVSAQGLKDQHGQSLDRDFAREIAFDDLWSMAEVGLQGSVFDPAGKRDIPIAMVNVKEAEITSAPLTEASILELENNESYPGSPPSFERIARLPGARTGRVVPTAASNVPFSHPVRVDDVLGGADRRGPIALAVQYTQRPGTPEARVTTRSAIAQVTDLGISAKVSQHGSLIWVSRLSSAAPVEGATVSIVKPKDTAPRSFITDASGFVTIPASAWSPAKNEQERSVIFVRSGQDWSYRRVDNAIYAWRFNVPVDSGEDRPFGLLFTERGIYRPGDTVQLKGIFREEAHPGTRTPAGKTVNVSVNGPDGESIAKVAPRLSEFGTLSAEVKIPLTSRLGTYSIEASVEGSPKGWADVTENFEVAEYRPAAFKVSAESDKPSYVRGDTMSCTTRGDYLFGAPMPNAEARLSVRRGPASFAPPGLDGFVVEESAYYGDLTDEQPREGEIQSAQAKLDAQGTARIQAPLALPGQRGAELVTCEADVTDVSRQSIAGSTSAIVHPAEHYIAVKPGADLFVASGAAQRPEILAVDPKGARVPGVAVRVELLQRTWSLARQKTGGGLHTVSTPVDKVVATCNVTTSGNPESCPLTPPAAGYYIVRATSADKRKNPVGAAFGLYALGEGVTGFRDTDKKEVELVADKKSYSVGDKARILVKSPFKAAEALVTVERSGIYSKWRAKLTGPMPTIEVPVTDDLRPNAFVSVLLVRGRSKPAPASRGKGDADVGAPAFRLGYATIPVNPESRRLKVAVSPNKTDYRPGEPVKVGVDVRDAKGQPAHAEVTLYAVDEGVLSLVGYETPDPSPVFAAPRPLKILTVETREAIAKVKSPYAALGLDKGLEGGSGGKEIDVRRDFRASAYYEASLITNEKGRVEATFKLPDSLTTYRIMAVTAAKDDRFGYGDARVTASRPLMARPAFPRIIRAGDALEAGVVVSSKGLAKTDVEVEVAAEGLTLKGSPRRTIALDAGMSEEVRYALSAPAVGKAKVRFRVRGGGAEDAVEIEREIVPPTSLEAAALYGETSSESAEKLGDMSALRTDVGGLEISLASTALVGLSGGVEQLIEYPYGCVEQITSRLVPLLPLRDLARDFSIKLPPNTDRLVASSVTGILAAQRGDGGFGMFADSPKANPWVTAYALWGLSEAKRRGVPVPARAIESATRFVRANLLEFERDPYALATAPFILYVLAANGTPDPGFVSRMFFDRAKLPLFSQALLLHAMVLSKADPRSIAALMSELEGRLRLDGPTARAVGNKGDGYELLMDSDTRTSALILRALLAARPSHPLAAKLAMGLLADRRGGAWRSTQETAWSLLALDDYRRAQEKSSPDFVAHVFLGPNEVHTATFRDRSTAQVRTSLPAAKIAQAGNAAIAFDVDGSGKLFYEARLRYARKELPSAPLDRGFFVKKTLRPVTAEALEKALSIVPDASVRALSGGDLVLADIVVVTPSPREFVVIDDPLPAGLEAVDARLATTARGLDVDAYGGADDEEPGWNDESFDQADAPWSFVRELRDDRVVFFVDHMAAGLFRYRYLARATTLGSFVLPPTRVEEMYTPEVFGRTGADRITVAPKK